jgi:hypothetical protein
VSNEAGEDGARYRSWWIGVGRLGDLDAFIKQSVDPGAAENHGMYVTGEGGDTGEHLVQVVIEQKKVAQYDQGGAMPGVDVRQLGGRLQ